MPRSLSRRSNIRKAQKGFEMIYAGDSWAIRGYTEANYKMQDTPAPGDKRMCDYWDVDYQTVYAPGQGNLAVLDRIQQLNTKDPIVWIWTEPGRDYHALTGRPQHEWLTREDYFELRDQLNFESLQRIRASIDNPIALVGGLSDIDPRAESMGYTVLHPSWQRWIAETLNSQWFKLGWGASDAGWRTHYNNVVPSRAVAFAWEEQIKEWCWWEEHGYFCHEHPSPKANAEFAEYLKPQVRSWLK